MPAKTISTATAEHYKWGGPHANQSDAWYLVRTPELNIIEELMPPGTAEARHHHVRARQFLYVLEGEANVEIEHHDFTVKPGEGIEISPGQSHQTKNTGHAPLRFILTSQPPSHDDRIDD